MKKKLVSVLLASAMIASTLAGCGNSDSGTTTEGSTTTDSGAETTEEDPNEKVGAQIEVDQSATDSVSVEGEYSDADLTVFIYAQDHEKAVYQSLIDKFMESTGAKVTFEVTTADEYGQKILAYKAAGDMPDIFYVGPDTVAANVDDGYVLPLDEYVRKLPSTIYGRLSQMRTDMTESRRAQVRSTACRRIFPLLLLHTTRPCLTRRALSIPILKILTPGKSSWRFAES